MIWLVSNIHRSGSSMMMRCLEAAGLDVAYDKESDGLNVLHPDGYIPNPHGFYQFTEPIGDDFYEKYNGKAIKCPIRGLTKLPSGEYKLIFIKRNPKEIRASMAKWTPFSSWGRDETLTYFYEEYVGALLSILQKRGDVSIITLNYADIISNPQKEFDKIGLNTISMSACVEPELYRLKLEHDGQ
jgi:hypothetical protein